MNDSQDDLPPDVKRMMRQSAIATDHQEKIRLIREKNSDISESGVLLPLWKSLGDGTPNYWQAMLVISAVTKLNIEASEEINKLPPALRAEATEALSKLLANQAIGLREIQQLNDETERQMKAVK